MPNDKINPYPISADSLPGDEQRIDYNTCLKSIPGSEAKSLETMEGPNETPTTENLFISIYQYTYTFVVTMGVSLSVLDLTHKELIMRY